MTQACLAREQAGTAQGYGSQGARHTTMAQQLKHSRGPQGDASPCCHLLLWQEFRPHSRKDLGPQQDLAWSVKKEQEPTGGPQPKNRLPQDELADKDCRAETHCSGQYGSGAVTSRQTFRRKRKAGSYLTPNTQNSI